MNKILILISLVILRHIGGVWYTHSNTHFQFLNNFTRISIHFFHSHVFPYIFSNACTKHPHSVCLAKKKIANLFYYLAYFWYYSWALLHFLILFMGPTVLFQLTFFFFYLQYFQQKNFNFSKINRFQTDPKSYK